jgi:hypothetical protein
LEWLVFDWETIGKVLTALGAAIGTGLGIWNFVEQRRERRRTLLGQLPKVEINTVSSDEWIPSLLRFSSTNEARFDVIRIEARGDVLLAPLLPPTGDFDPADPPPPHADLEKAAKSLSASLRVEIPRERGFTFVHGDFWIKSRSDRSRLATSRQNASINLICEWTSAKRERFTLHVRI